MTAIARAADRHLILSALHEAKPKPKKQAKVKRVPIEKQRKILEKQIENVLKMIIAWRDGQVCVMGQIDGARCGNGLMWNHFIAQGQSHWMRLDLGNVYWGCGSHNLLDKYGDPILGMWVQSMFGLPAVIALRNEAKTHVKQKRTFDELTILLSHYDELYQNRFYVNLDLQSLIKAGYYGEIVRIALA